MNSKLKKILIITPLALLSVFIVIFFLLKPSPAPTPGVSTPSYQSYTNQTSSPAVSFQNLTDKELVSEAKIIYLATYNQSQVREFFEPIINDYNLSGPTTIPDTDYISWNNQAANLDVNVKTAQFTFKQSVGQAPGTSSINEADALLVAKNWLIKYKLIPEIVNSRTVYLQSDGVELEPTPINQPGAYLEFQFYPVLDKLPLWPSYEQTTAPISVTISNKGELFYVNFQLPAVFYSSLIGSPQTINQLPGTNKDIKTSKQVNEAITSNQAVITLLESQPGVPVASQNVLEVMYQKPVLGYQYLTLGGTNQLLPAFRLTGTGKLESGDSVFVTAYLPALAE